MATITELQAHVASSFNRLGLPSWPNPHPGMTSPPEEEYSRLTDPGRYAIVHARARVWARVLEEALEVRSESLRPVAKAGDIGRVGFDRGVRLTSDRPDALPLLLLERDVPTQPGEALLAVQHIGVARPEIVVESQPDCGCDACDSGSSDLLEAVDSAVRRVVGGPVVVLRGEDWQAQWHPDGGQASGVAGSRFRELMELCRRLAAGEDVTLPREVEVLVGRSWLG
jgi:Family of unknown function (DUF6226)